MGEWHANPISYLTASRVICELCGQLVPGQFWEEEIEGSRRVFCNPDHAARYESYWLPLYGKAASR